jgi:hypothetical protein
MSDLRVRFEQSEIVTPRVRTTARRLLFWLGAAVVLVLIAIVGLALVGTAQSTARLSATNPHSVGAEALVQVLRQDGVHVVAPRSLSRAIADSSANSSATTLVLYDQNSILDSGQLDSLRTVARNLVLIEPSYSALTALAPGERQAGVVPGTASANCRFLPARRAGAVGGLSKGYRITSAPGATGCLGSHGVYSLVRVATPNGTVTVLGSTTALTNGAILDRGDAALALGLFGSTPNLIWYLPSLADARVATPDGIIPNPPWVTLVIGLAALVLIAAGIWRGRRFGPLVVENLPVVVRASETAEGRARLYQKSSARTHALDALRIGAIGRMASTCGLPKRATLDEVIGAVSRITGRSVASVRALLVDDTPTNDSGLIRLSDELRLLEDELTAAVLPG